MKAVILAGGLGTLPETFEWFLKRGRGEEGERGRGVKWLNAKSLNLLLTTDY